MQTLKLSNYSEQNIVEQTQLTAIVNPSSNSLPVANTNDFTTGFVLIGTIGSKTAEMVASTNPSSTTSIPLSVNTTLQHEQYEPVYALFGNQIRLYRAANVDGTQPANSAFTLLDTVTIDPNGTETLYTDADGGGDYWYKSTYYNSVTQSETDRTISEATRGYFTVNYCELSEIRQEAGFKYAAYIDDAQIDQKRQAAQDEINSALAEFYEVPLQPPIPDNLKQICIRLAAGYLRKAQYSAISDPKTNGQDMVDDAELELDKLVIKERELMTKDGKSLAEPGGTGQAGGWPDQTTATADPSQGGAPRYFRMSDIQGTGIVGENDQYFGNSYQGRRW